jgi:hypothetical protein
VTPQPPSIAPDWEAIRRELLAMAERDRTVRDALERDGALSGGYHPRMEAVHRENARRLTEILDAYGWPKISLVGKEAGEAAWLIVQHAIGDPALMRRGLALLTDAVGAGEASPVHRVMLEDRIRVFEGRGQRYGTQLDWDDGGELSPSPLEDPEGVDARRESVGLPPLADDVRRRREAMAASNERPQAGSARRQREYQEWLRRTGWRP